MSPCGMIVDYLRSCYSTNVRWVQNDGRTIRIRWYRAAPGAKTFPFPSAFGSSVWEGDYGQVWQGPGEINREREWNKCTNYGQKGQSFCGDPQWFRTGVPLSHVNDPGCKCDDRRFARPMVEVDASGSEKLNGRGAVEVEALGVPRQSARGLVEVEASGSIVLLAAGLVEVEASGSIVLLAAGLVEVEAIGQVAYSPGGLVEVEAIGMVAGSDTVSTDCCPSVSIALTLAVSGFSAFTWANGTFALTFNPMTNTWQNNYVSGGTNFLWELHCQSGIIPPIFGWNLHLYDMDCLPSPQNQGGGLIFNPIDSSCSPFLLVGGLTLNYDHCTFAGLGEFGGATISS